MVKINGETKLIPIIGDPIIYAKSPEWLSAEFEKRGFNAVCVPMQVSGNDLESVLAGLSPVPNVTGILVTMPHKQPIPRYCSTLSDRSRALGAVSVMRRNGDGGWHGDLLDGKSFVKAQIDHGAQVKGARALLLGAGGAGSAIAMELCDAGIGELVIYDADETRAQRVAGALHRIAKVRAVAGPPDPRGFDLVCNATPLGMAAGDPLPLDPHLLSPENFVGDVIAGHGETPLMREARRAGCRTANGDNMVEAVLGITVDFMFDPGVN